MTLFGGAHSGAGSETLFSLCRQARPGGTFKNPTALLFRELGKPGRQSEPPAPSRGCHYSFFRGGLNSDESNDLVIVHVHPTTASYNLSSRSVEGSLFSAPVAVEYATLEFLQYSAFYEGPNGELYFYNAYKDEHEQVPGITLP